MKARKEFKSYLAMWILSIIVFHILIFIFKRELIGDRITQEITLAQDGTQYAINVFKPMFLNFLYSYIFVMLAFVAQLVCTYIFLSQESLKKTMYNYPIFEMSLQGLIAAIIFAIIFVAVNLSPILSLIFFIILTFVSVCRCIMAKTAANMVSAKDENIELKTQYIKVLKEESQLLLNKANDSKEKELIKSICDKVRFSDPMSSVELKEVEEKMVVCFESITNLINNNKYDELKKACTELCNLIDERNVKVKSNKK